MTKGPETSEETAVRLLTEAVTGERDVYGQIDVLATVLVMQRGVGMSAWERGFCAALADRFARYGERIALSDKQRAIIARIHDRYKHTLVI